MPERYLRVGVESQFESIPLDNIRPSNAVSSRDRLLNPYSSSESSIQVNQAGSSRITSSTNEPSNNPPRAPPVRASRAERLRPSTIVTSLTPILPPDGYASLNWRPSTLQTSSLLLMAVLCLSIAGATVALLQSAGADLQFLLTNDNIHTMSTYAPAVVATITILFFRAMVLDFCRMMPYYAMADGKHALTAGACAKASIGGKFYPWPDTIVFGWGWQNTLYNFLQQIMNVSAFLTAMKVVLLQSKRTPDGWTLIVNPWAAKYIIVAYVLAFLVYLLILWWTLGHNTGLKWDPASVQDQLTLFSDTRATIFVEQLSASKTYAHEYLSKGSRYRIGYWGRTRIFPDGSRSDDVCYGICQLQPSDQPTVIHEPVPTAPTQCVPKQACSCRRFPNCKHGPRRYCVRSSWGAFIFQFFNLLFYLAGIAGAIWAFAYGSFTNGFKIRDTWKNPNVHFTYWIIGGQPMTDTNLPYAMVFRFLPTQLAFWTVDHIRFLDTSVRASQPWRSMAQAPTLGTDSIAMEYSTMLAFQIPLVAFQKGHYRVTWFTAVNAISSLCPIFVAGLIIIQKDDDYITFRFERFSFFAVLFYCLVFSVSIIWAWTRDFDRLPRRLYSIADHMSLFRGSRILEERRLSIADPKINREKFQAKMILLENKYQTGFYDGTCGHSHFGCDVVETSSERSDYLDFTCNLINPVASAPGVGTRVSDAYRRLRSRRARIAVPQEEVEA